MKQLRYHLPSFIIWMVVFYFLSERSIFRYKHMGAGVDIGLFENLFYNLVHYDKAVTSIGMNEMSHHYFSDHINWYIYPLSLLYRFFPYVESLLIFQALVLSSPILILPLFQKDNLSKWIYPLLYALFLPIYWIQIFDFHPEVLWIPLFFLFYYFWKQQSSYWILFFILSLLTKEESALVWIVFSLIEENSKKGERIFIGIVSIVYFIFSIILLSQLNEVSNGMPRPAHWERYQNPIVALQYFHLFPYLFLFLNIPFLFLQFRNKLILCLVPYLFYSLFSSYEVNKTPFTHHSFIAVPIILISFIEGIKTLNEKNKYIAKYLSLFVSILIFGFFGPSSKSYSYRKDFLNPGVSEMDVKILRGLLEGKSIVSNVPQYLSNRTTVQLFLPNHEYTADYFVFYTFPKNTQIPNIPKHYQWEQTIEKQIQIYKRTEN
ncbi:DUF2079 domain-containing protein [Leptospira congkakensis]|uniref:DUF2079 domain-containing protein n=1 Tax=Leptospira congkakensis TaxID=2484932 RepID=A0A4Z1ADH2_9LEPT|nr:DUF2079 domain-containing protein [Leptospira congkakensis]TGL86266.1 DUF2079 domain-containing protein [Leptospira congkakensis]TGL94189.1 DUF2079 domain-containing protein [Leptospira congkakensis]TGL94402.1 DUF2079 domain-containing protein [Leptospira congkakensis]